MPFFYKIPRNKIIHVVIDALIVLFSWVLSLLLSSYHRTVPILKAGDILYIIYLLASYLLCFYFFQIYRVLWRYSHSRDYVRMAYSSLGGGVVFYATGFISASGYRTIEYFLSMLLIFLLCSFYRLLERDRSPEHSRGDETLSRKILIVGAGEAGRLILSEYYNRKIGTVIAAFADDDREKIGSIINGKMVTGPLVRLPQIVDELGVNEVIVAMPSVSSARVDESLAAMRRSHPALTVKTLPPITRVFDDLPLVPDLMDSSLASLLNRDEFEIDLSSIEKIFSGKTVLVTGAGGSIGSELCKQVLKFGIGKLVAVGKGEHSIYTLAKSMGEYAGFIRQSPVLVYRIADVRDRVMMENIFSVEKPDIVFHAAAHKHVPLMEFNEAEALRNNVCGTRTVLEMASRYDARRFVLVSTDKAVNPSSIMGVSKRIAELTAAVYFRERGLRTAVVRFGNVLGSRGSVVPLFLEQIRKGGPVTVTHPQMTRYFMSIPEAALLVINAAALSEKGETFVLDMGSPYRIAGIAEKLIRMHGLEPGKDIMIEYTGLRPGEKIEEKLFYSMDDLAVTGNKKIHILKKENPPLDSAALFDFIEQCESGISISSLGPLELRKRLQEIVPEYGFYVPNDIASGSSRLVS